MHRTTSEMADQLRADCLPEMVSFQSDLEHDREFLFNYAGEFVHICNPTSTHIYPIPESWGDDAQRPYLFGRSRPSEIARGELAVIKYADTAGAMFHVGDTRSGRLQKVTGKAAILAMAAGIRRADAKQGKAEGDRVSIKTLNREVSAQRSDLTYTELLELAGLHKLRIRIRSNFYMFQCHAIVERWNGEAWHEVYQIDPGAMQTPAGLSTLHTHPSQGVRADQTPAFQPDRETLISAASSVLV